MRYGTEHKQQTHKRVLTAAARAIREQGPERVSVSTVMGEVGLTNGGFYAHFSSKDALIAEGIEYMFAQVNIRMQEVIEGKDAREALHDYIDYYLSDRHVKARGRGCPIAAIGSDLPRLDGAAQKAFADGMAIQHQRLQALFDSMGTANPDDSAYSLRSELLGALLSARLVSAGNRDALLDASRRSLKQRFGLGS